MPTLSGLPGTTGDVEATWCGSVTAAAEALKHGEAITAAGANGAITAWSDDTGKLRCEFHRRRETIDSKSLDHLASVVHWLKEWFPQLRRE